VWRHQSPHGPGRSRRLWNEPAAGYLWCGAHPAEARQLFHVDVDQVSRHLTFIALQRRLKLKVWQTLQSQMVQGSGHGGGSSVQQPDDVGEKQPLMAQFHCALEVLRTARPPLSAANAASLHQSGGAT
jgi:hypothetical protein